MEGCTDIQTRKDGRKEGGKREKRGEGGRGRKGVNRMCSALSKGRRAQDLAVVGFTFAYRVRLHINPSLLPVSPGPCWGWPRPGRLAKEDGVSATYRCECRGGEQRSQDRRGGDGGRKASGQLPPSSLSLLSRLSPAPFLTVQSLVQSLVQKGKGLQKRPRGVWLGTRWAHMYGAGWALVLGWAEHTHTRNWGGPRGWKWKDHILEDKGSRSRQALVTHSQWLLHAGWLLHFLI